VITYRMSPTSWWIMSRYRHMPWAGLPNIIAGEFVAPEFLQDEATADNLAQAVLNLLFDGTVRDRVETRFEAMAAELKQDSAARIAEGILPLVRPAAS
jgi:lipid-A-disaccharide synthase